MTQRTEDGRLIYFIRIKRYNSEEVLEKHPNLTAPYWVKIGEMYSYKSPNGLRQLEEDTLKEQIEDALERDLRNPENETLESEEDIDVIPGWNTEGYNPIYEGKVSVPVGDNEDEEDEESEDFSDVSKSDNSLGCSEALM